MTDRDQNLDHGPGQRYGLVTTIVARHIRFLAPGGLLVSVMTASVLWRQDRQQTTFRELVKHACEILKILLSGKH